jgi:chromosome segregation ATPase
MIFLNPATWSTIYYGYMNLVHSARRGIATENPIGVLDTAMSRYDAKLEQVDTHLANTAAAAKRIQSNINKALEKAREEANIVTMLQRDNKPRNLIEQHAVASARWQKAAETLQPYVTMLANAGKQLGRARDYIKDQIADLQNQRDTLKVQLEGMTEGQASAKALKKMFANNMDFQMAKLAIDEADRRSTEAEAEIDQYIRNINPILESNDIARSAEAEAAMARFDGFLRGEKPAAALPAAPVVDGVVLSVEKEKVSR